ncbi:MAG: hypothetical protein ACKOWF_12110 [Chloroflexota bacterium]
MSTKLVTWSASVGEDPVLVSTETYGRRMVVACTDGVLRVGEETEDDSPLRGFRLLAGMSVEIRASPEIYIWAETEEADASILVEYDEAE